MADADEPHAPGPTSDSTSDGLHPLTVELLARHDRRCAPTATALSKRPADWPAADQERAAVRIRGAAPRMANLEPVEKTAVVSDSTGADAAPAIRARPTRSSSAQLALEPGNYPVPAPSNEVSVVGEVTNGIIIAAKAAVNTLFLSQRRGALLALGICRRRVLRAIALGMLLWLGLTPITSFLPPPPPNTVLATRLGAQMGSAATTPPAEIANDDDDRLGGAFLEPHGYSGGAQHVTNARATGSRLECSAEARAVQTDRLRARFSELFKHSACPTTDWLDEIEDFWRSRLAGRGDGRLHMLDVGCNKGYASAALFARFRANSSVTPRSLFHSIRDQTKAYSWSARDLRPCGACSDCNEPSAASSFNVPLTVHCFEPSASMFTLLKASRSRLCAGMPDATVCNQRTGDPDLWHLHPLGVDRKSRVLWRQPGCMSETCELLESRSEAASEAVHVTSIDDFATRLGDPVDFLKIDTEGRDPDVLAGAENVLRKYQPLVLFEYNTGLNPPSRWREVPLEQVVSQLDNLGYDCYYLSQPHGISPRMRQRTKQTISQAPATYRITGGCLEPSRPNHSSPSILGNKPTGHTPPGKWIGYWANVGCVPRTSELLRKTFIRLATALRASVGKASHAHVHATDARNIPRTALRASVGNASHAHVHATDARNISRGSHSRVHQYPDPGGHLERNVGDTLPEHGNDLPVVNAAVAAVGGAVANGRDDGAQVFEECTRKEISARAVAQGPLIINPLSPYFIADWFFGIEPFDDSTLFKRAKAHLSSGQRRMAQPLVDFSHATALERNRFKFSANIEAQVDIWRFLVPANWTLHVVASGDVVYVQVNVFPFFAKHFLPQLKVPIRLITGQHSAPSLERSILTDATLKSSMIRTWWSQNAIADYVGHPKYHPMPYGVKLDQLQQYLKTYRLYDNHRKPSRSRLVLLSPMSQTSPFRRRLYSALEQRNKSLADLLMERSRPRSPFRNELFEDMKTSVFVVSPAGDREDCHRHWEAVGLGAVPICNCPRKQFFPLFGSNMVYADDTYILQIVLGNTSHLQKLASVMPGLESDLATSDRRSRVLHMHWANQIREEDRPCGSKRLNASLGPRRPRRSQSQSPRRPRR